MPGRKQMTGKVLSFEDVREIASRLDGVEEGTSYRGPSLKVRGKLMACPAIHKSAEPNSLVVRVDFGDRDELIAADPDVYYVTDHYVGYPSVLVRLAKIRRDSLEGLLKMSRGFLIAKEKRVARKGPKASFR